MKCKNCGEELPEGSVFCGNCGTRLDVSAGFSESAEDEYDTDESEEYDEDYTEYEEPEAEEEPDDEPEQKYYEEKRPVQKRPVADTPKKKLPIGPIIGIVAALAVVVVVAIVAVNFIGSGSGKNHYFSVVYDTSDEVIVVTYDNKAFTIQPDDDIEDASIKASTDTCLVISAKVETEEYDEEYDEYYTTYTEQYYFVYGYEKYCQLTDDGSTCSIAVDANAVAYINEDYELYLYNGKKSEHIADDISSVRISPDGKTLVYRTYEEDAEDAELVIYQNGKSEKIAEGMRVVSVSNKGKYIYAYDTDNRLYVLNAKGESEKIQSSIDTSSCEANSDKTEVMYTSDGNTYVSVKGGEKQKLFDSDNVWMVDTDNDTLDADEFEGHYYMEYDYNSSDSTLYYLNKKFETTKIATSVRYARVSANEKTVIYVKNNGIYEYSLSKDESEKIIKDISSETFTLSCFAVSEDGKSIYYINEDDELCYYNGKEAKVIDDDGDAVELVYSYGDAMFFLYDEYTKYDENGYYEYTTYDLYYYKNGDSKAKSITSDVSSITVDENYIYYTTYDGDVYEKFVSSDGKKFSSIMEYEE